MYSNQSKVYYVETSNKAGGMANSNTNSCALNLLDSLFINSGISIIANYNTNNLLGYDNELINLVRLQIANPSYAISPISNTISELIKIINDLNNSKLNLENQINIGTSNDSNLVINVIKKDIVQNSSIKLLYVQYLLMYDLKLTNGVFIESYLLNAAAVLAANGNSLVIDYIQHE